MMINQLTETQHANSTWLGRSRLPSDVDLMEPDSTDLMRRGVGTVSWPGAYGEWWQADPNDGST